MANLSNFVFTANNTYTGSNHFAGASVFDGGLIIPYISSYKITNITDSGLVSTQRGDAILFADDSTPVEVMNAEVGATTLTNQPSGQFKVPLCDGSIIARCNNSGYVKAFYTWSENTSTEITLTEPIPGEILTGDGYLYTATAEPILSTNIVDVVATNYMTVLSAASNCFLSLNSWSSWLASSATSASPIYINAGSDGSRIVVEITSTHLTNFGAWLSGQGLFDAAGTAITQMQNLSNKVFNFGYITAAGASNVFVGMGPLTNVSLAGLGAANGVITGIVGQTSGGTGATNLAQAIDAALPNLTNGYVWNKISSGILARTQMMVAPTLSYTATVSYAANKAGWGSTLALDLTGPANLILDAKDSGSSYLDMIKMRSASYYNVIAFRDKLSASTFPAAYCLDHYGTNTYSGQSGRGDLYIGSSAGVYYDNPSTGYGLFFKGTNSLESTLPLWARSNLTVTSVITINSLGSNAPSATTGASKLYTKMVLGTNNLYALDENGNETILSAHIGNRHVARSVNHYTGEGQIIDLLALAKAVQALTGDSNIITNIYVPRRDWGRGSGGRATDGG